MTLVYTVPHNNYGEGKRLPLSFSEGLKKNNTVLLWCSCWIIADPSELAIWTFVAPVIVIIAVSTT